MVAYEAIDHAVMVVPAGVEGDAFERAGLSLTPWVAHPDVGADIRSFSVGGFTVPILRWTDPDIAARTAVGARVGSRTGLCVVVLRVPDLDGALGELSGRGAGASRTELRTPEGDEVGGLAVLDGPERSGLDVALVSFRSAETPSQPSNDLALKRLDHLAAFTSDLESTTSFWTDVLGVPVAGEIASPAMTIRQMKVGDAVIELLGRPGAAAGGRPGGLSSMCAFEVDDLDAVVAFVRERGFTAPDPRNGILPGSRTSSIPGGELHGLGIQLIEWTR